MTRTSFPRESHAAYAAFAASQPLFDALHHATARIAEQQWHLSSARDTVQRTHVQLAQRGATGDHGTYVAAVVKAWRSAAETYRPIFREMARITAADPTEGRRAARGHDAFARMADSAGRANELAMSFPLAASPGAKRAAAAAAGPDEQSTKRTRLPSGGADDGDARASKAHQETRTPAAKPPGARGKRVPPADEGGAMQRSRKRRAVTRTLGTRHENHPSGHPHTTAQTSGPRLEGHVPGIEYEDLSAAVGARLHAKAEKTKKKTARKQQDKKRKRESADSTAPDFAGMLARADKPAKKKAKPESGAAQQTEGKRKPALPADVTNGGGGRRRKRKTRHV
ncbi:hypothetical protein EJ03DRAFT_348079 [Teratosphaeria nubilosa]|uniref:Uncharacterized protein n=1 Tax=Teratosphaeria nubilosa TaxID=161662 RepID=A0A6G1LKS6_9PEZI|nr:hypothetical protein EJ03DRAFT_348079 [Teratosphaeria nubilosa]